MGSVRTITDQHEEIKVAAERLRVVAEWKGEALGTELVRRVFRLDVSALLDVLRAHFAFEEQGGYMHWLVDSRPELAPEAKRLQEQHHQILREMEEVLVQVSDAGVDELKRAVVLALDELATHEAAESAFLRRQSEG